ncbi:hypothetical protein N7G274_001077 [Stereocaulon virgatum]|uniref:Uncharacterized protein n=1 Tax=Stereocaulon virgatum TaxID=373712 RepID=A0ABR4APL2_9LECA
METYPVSTRRRLQDQVFVWDSRFGSRQKHHLESHRLTPENQDSIVTTFIRELRSRLDSPQHDYTALRDFLEKANEDDLKAIRGSAHDDKIRILLDDRRDDTGWEVNGLRHWARDWNSYADGYPPEGQNVVSSMMNAKGLYRKQQRSQLADGAERRILCISDLSPLCGLALIATAPRYQAPILRDYLQRYIRKCVFFGVQISVGFTLEFHLPYYALRSHAEKKEDS